MPRWFPAIAVLLIAGGAAAGYFSVPHYYRPASSGEARLRERAADYYRDSVSMQLDKMQRFFTPPHQLDDTKDLLKRSGEIRKERDKSPESMLGPLRQQAESIKPEELTVDSDGTWAVVGGSYTVVGKGKDPSVSIPLSKTVWVRRAGEWWIYLLKPSELACYGNPPEFARQIVASPGYDHEQGMLKGKRVPTPGEPPAASPPSVGLTPPSSATPAAPPPATGTPPGQPAPPAPPPVTRPAVPAPGAGNSGGH